MTSQKAGFEYLIFGDIAELLPEDAALLEKARAATGDAYAPYSRFSVGAAALLQSGQVVCGTNQENASFPAGICAEQATLAAVASHRPKSDIVTMAISYSGQGIASDHPISPCGVCRQILSEYEERTGRPLKLILGGMKGPVYMINSARDLLPLAFTKDELPPK